MRSFLGTAMAAALGVARYRSCRTTTAGRTKKPTDDELRLRSHAALTCEGRTLLTNFEFSAPRDSHKYMHVRDAGCGRGHTILQAASTPGSQVPCPQLVINRYSNYTQTLGSEKNPKGGVEVTPAAADCILGIGQTGSVRRGAASCAMVVLAQTASRRLQVACFTMCFYYLCRAAESLCTDVRPPWKFYLFRWEDIQDETPALHDCGVSLYAAHLYARLETHQSRVDELNEASFMVFLPLGAAEEYHFPEHNSFWPKAYARKYSRLGAALDGVPVEDVRRACADKIVEHTCRLLRNSSRIPDTLPLLFFASSEGVMNLQHFQASQLGSDSGRIIWAAGDVRARTGVRTGHYNVISCHLRLFYHHCFCVLGTQQAVHRRVSCCPTKEPSTAQIRCLSQGSRARMGMAHALSQRRCTRLMPAWLCWI